MGFVEAQDLHATSELSLIRPEAQLQNFILERLGTSLGRFILNDGQARIIRRDVPEMFDTTSFHARVLLVRPTEGKECSVTGSKAPSQSSDFPSLRFW